MNKRFTALSTITTFLTTLALAGCATTPGTNNTAGNAVGTATDIGMNVLKVAIDTQCRSEIEKQNVWRIASVAMTDSQKEATKTKVCSCVSEQAPQQITLVDMGNAAIDPAYRTQLVTKVVAKSLQRCYGNIVKK